MVFCDCSQIKRFYSNIIIDGYISLKNKHNYYYQVQDQLTSCFRGQSSGRVWTLDTLIPTFHLRRVLSKSIKCLVQKCKPVQSARYSLLLILLFIYASLAVSSWDLPHSKAAIAPGDGLYWIVSTSFFKIWLPFYFGAKVGCSQPHTSNSKTLPQTV